jgi:hypothetical protein
MLTLFLWAISIVSIFTDLFNVSVDAQSIVLAICIASDLNILTRLFWK